MIPESIYFNTPLRKQFKPRYSRTLKIKSGCKDLVGFWILNELGGSVVHDISGLENSGILINAPAWVIGKFNGAALEFDGVNQRISIGAMTHDSFEDFTIAVWVRPDNTDANGIVFDVYDGATDRITLRQITLGSGRWRLETTESGSTYNTISDAPPSGDWEHVVVLRRNGNTEMWIDGVQQSDSDAVTGTLSGLSTPRIGSSFLGTTPFDGVIDHLRFYACALTEEEVRKLYLEPFWDVEDPYSFPLSFSTVEAQTITPSGITGTEAFGVQQLDFKLEPGTILSSEAFGTAKVNFNIEPISLILSGAFGTTKINFKLEPNALISAEGIGNHQLNFNLIPTSVTSSEIIGSHQLNFNIEPNTLISFETIGNHQLGLNLTPISIISLETIGNHQLNFNLAPASIISSEIIGNHQLNFNLIPVSVTSSEIISNHQLNLKLILSSLVSAEAFGLQQFNFRLFPNAIISDDNLGNVQLNLNVLPDSIIGAEALGITQLNLHLLLNSVASIENFGNILLSIDQTILANAIITAEAFGITKLNFALLPSAITSLENFGTAQLDMTIKPVGISEIEAIGIHTLVYDITISLTGLPTSEFFGSLLISKEAEFRALAILVAEKSELMTLIAEKSNLMTLVAGKTNLITLIVEATELMTLVADKTKLTILTSDN